jgi:DNA-directed RNA polymerase specialized sigma54-like protein
MKEDKDEWHIKLKPYRDFFPRVTLNNKTIKHFNRKKLESKLKCRRQINDFECE